MPTMVQSQTLQYPNEDEIKKILTDMKTSQPAIGWSHPEWLVEKWRRNFGDQNTYHLLEWNNKPPATFARINTIKTDAHQLMDRWREETVDFASISRDWTGENLAFELKKSPVTKLTTQLARWLVLCTRSQYTARPDSRRRTAR